MALCKEKKNLIIFNNQWTFCVQLLALVCYLLKIPYIWWVRGVPSYEGNILKLLVWHLSQKWLIAGAQCIICSSKKSIERIKFKLPNTKIKIIEIPNLINFPNIHNAHKLNNSQLNIEKSEINLLSVGRFHKSKRVLELVKKCPLHINEKKVRLVLVGYAYDKTYIKSIIEIAKKRNLDICIKNNVSKNYLREIHLKSDIFITLSNIENFGNAIAEALAYGMPAVINNETDFWPHVNCKNVFICSDDTLKIAIENAVTYSKNHSQIERMNIFRNFWHDFSYNKYNKLLNILIAFKH